MLVVTGFWNRHNTLQSSIALEVDAWQLNKHVNEGTILLAVFLSIRAEMLSGPFAFQVSGFLKRCNTCS